MLNDGRELPEPDEVQDQQKISILKCWANDTTASNGQIGWIFLIPVRRNLPSAGTLDRLELSMRI